MPITVYKVISGKFINITDSLGLSDTNGLYNKIHSLDINADGYNELIIGNYGLNSMFEASVDKPLTMYVNDFDRNGRFEQILGMYYEDKLYPIVQLKDLWMQLPYLKKKYLKFDSYKNKDLNSLLNESAMENTRILEVNNLASLQLNNLNGVKFEIDTLPFMALVTCL